MNNINKLCIPRELKRYLRVSTVTGDEDLCNQIQKFINEQPESEASEYGAVLQDLLSN